MRRKDLPGAEVIARALGNILQAADAGHLERERDFILVWIDDWQAALARLQADNESLKHQLRAERERVAILDDQTAELKERLGLSQARLASLEGTLLDRGVRSS
jgi:hypothetical protein